MSGHNSEFKNYHPIVNFLYFLCVIILSMVNMNPVCLAVSLFSGLAYSIMLKGGKALKFNLFYIFPLMLTCAVLNPVFNHEGVTTLAILPSGNPLTLESILYGIAAAVMLAGVIGWFSCFNEVITSDKIVYLFGKIIPSLSLVISMVLRFVPKFKTRLKEVNNSQKSIGRDLTDGNIICKAKNLIRIMSVMITWSLESSVETADSMKSRGYGLPGRTAFSNFKFDRRDGMTVLYIFFLTIYITLGSIAGAIDFVYFPKAWGVIPDPYGISVYFAYLLLFITPVIIEEREALKWKRLKSKI